MLSRREAPRHQDYLVVVFMVLFAMNNHHSKQHSVLQLSMREYLFVQQDKYHHFLDVAE